MANWFGNYIVITAETEEELLDYIRTSAEEDKLGTVDSVEAYEPALNEANGKAEDGLWLSNPPGMFLEAHLLSETTLSIDVRTPNASPLFKWAERVLAKYKGITISGSSCDTMNDDHYELYTIYKEDGDYRTISGKYIPQEQEIELEEYQPENPIICTEFSSVENSDISENSDEDSDLPF